MVRARSNKLKPLHNPMENYSHSLAGSRSVIQVRTSPQDPLALDRFKNPYTLNANMAVAWSFNPLEWSLSRRMSGGEGRKFWID